MLDKIVDHIMKLLLLSFPAGLFLVFAGAMITIFFPGQLKLVGVIIVAIGTLLMVPLTLCFLVLGVHDVIEILQYRIMKHKGGTT